MAKSALWPRLKTKPLLAMMGRKRVWGGSEYGAEGSMGRKAHPDTPTSTLTLKLTTFLSPPGGIYLISTSPRGLWRQTRFGHARGERSRPQFTAHNSLRPLKSGLSLGGPELRDQALARRRVLAFAA